MNVAQNRCQILLLGIFKIWIKGCKKKRLPPQKWLLLSQFLHYIYVTPITGSGILTDFQIILENFGETCSFWFMVENVPKGRFFKLPGKKIHMALVYLS